MILSVVVPCYNERESIAVFLGKLFEVLEAEVSSFEVIVVNDGSIDGTAEILQDLVRPDLKVIHFSRNFGHQAALTAGYERAIGEFVVTLDSDLQHPPELIPQMLSAALSKGVDVVYGVRPDRSDDTFFKRNTARVYYRALRGLSGIQLESGAADFRLMSRKAVDEMLEYSGSGAVFRLLVPSLSFSSASLPFRANARFAGSSKYNLKKMISLSTASVLAFSTKPLTIAIRLGFFVSLLSFIGFAYALLEFLVGRTLPGWASLISAVLLLFGTLFLLLGIVGAYIGSIIQKLDNRPTYRIRED